MNAAQLLPVFVVGLAGSIHCAGMCGGIVTAMSATAPRAVVPANAGNHAELPVRRSMGSGFRRNDGPHFP